MAPTLTSSNTFLQTKPPHSRSHLKISSKTPTLPLPSFFSPFPKPSKPNTSSSQTTIQSTPDAAAAAASSSGKPSTPFFDIGKIPDVKSLVPMLRKPEGGGGAVGFRRKDAGTVFVAGGSGQVGIRITQSLLRKGFSVRAGVPELHAAHELALLASTYKIISTEESNRLNAVESTFDDAESIAKAIGNASKVVVTIGPAENGPASEVSTSDALQVIEAAQLARVDHVAIVYDGSATAASTHNVLERVKTFFHNLFSQPQPTGVNEFLQKVIETDVGFTFMKTCLTEDFSAERSYTVVVSAEGSAGAKDHKVAKYQIASVVADVFSNTAVAENKVVDVFTDPSAPSRSVDELFSAISKDGRREAYAEALAKAKSDEEANKATEKAADPAKKPEEDDKELSVQDAKATSLAEARQKAEAHNFLAQNALVKQHILKLPEPKKDPKAKQIESKTEVRKVFGGLFQ